VGSLPSDESHPGTVIVALVTELEHAIATAEEALVAREWTQLELLLADQRRVTQAIANAVAATDGQRPARFNIELRRRLDVVDRRRADQLRRLKAFHDAVGSRLSVMARAKAMRRATQQPGGPQPALIDSRR
jgi:hypothetical protein